MNKTKLKMAALVGGIILCTSNVYASLDDAKQLKIISYNVYNGMLPIIVKKISLLHLNKQI